MNRFWILDFGFSIGRSSGARASFVTCCALLLMLCAVLVVLRVSADAQVPKKVPRIGYLSARDPASDSTRSKGILLGLRELGYVDGKNISIVYRYSDGKRERFTELHAPLVETVEVPDHALRKHRMLIQGDEFP